MKSGRAAYHQAKAAEDLADRLGRIEKALGIVPEDDGLADADPLVPSWAKGLATQAERSGKDLADRLGKIEQAIADHAAATTKKLDAIEAASKTPAAPEQQPPPQAPEQPKPKEAPKPEAKAKP
jgi:hypothetical protein